MGKILNIIVCGVSLISVICCLPYFIYFISLHSSTSTTSDENDAKITKNGEKESVLLPLICNLLLLIVFVMQHSIMATTEVKQWFSQMEWQVVERSIFNLLTSTTLILLMYFWQRMPETVIWSVNTADCAWSWWTFTTLHFCAWYVVYSGAISLDFPELLGVKQVSYDIQQLEKPLKYKSAEQRRMYTHMRHPSFSAFCILFWVHPLMSLDRLLLALVWTLYMLSAWTVDSLDHNYICKQQTKKQHELTTGCRSLQF